ncbi:glycosyltransferase [Zobellia galactanivorans]|uniref:glycosyltransferase n=1 Tax=Zobellia galactanivorans (strain DSM 12802 / CCUG 47099 / CIP 106680 / NCIMB 13871 / Dsij) TaxID=63186 RepID=UPI001C075F7A|nr:glycosyltransferase [Zobellia galactanivorans]MBU3026685.1 glycosyltransferase [Zobellia galactanivorans]
MKILQVNKYFFPDIGGVETVVKQYAQAVNKEHTVRVLCVHKDLNFKTVEENIDGVKVLRCSSLGTFMSMPISFSFYFHFFKLYRKYEVFHFHEPFPLASLLALFVSSKRKIVVTWHSDIIKQKALKKIVEYFQSLLCKKATFITTTSPDLLNYSSVLKPYRDKVKILPLGIDFNATGAEAGDYILYLGRLSYYKGINTLLDAFIKAETDRELVIVGDGDKKIVDLIVSAQKKTSKKIKFINKFVDEEEKQYFLRNCLFFVFPSIAASEAFGIIQLEAMVYGKPVINTNLPTGVPFVSLNNITGLTVEPSNVDELANAIDKLSFNEDLVKSMGANAVERVRSCFSNAKIMADLKALYNEL